LGTILDKILEVKRTEVSLLHQNGTKLQALNRPKRSFIEKLEKADELAVIAEFKRASPSKGIINESLNPAEQASFYESNGASAISVLTDSTFFKGSFCDLQAIREAVDLPILCKDFVIDYLQIDAAANSGADIILLIAAALDNSQLMELYQHARECELEVLVEAHNREELERALKTGAKLIGINNRDLKTFQVSIGVTEELAPIVKQSGAFLISESGINGLNDVNRIRQAGANGILVGEALMRSSNLNQLFEEFRQPLLKETGR
jgi:indole-3-glycerol phosphate synthase